MGDYFEPSNISCALDKDIRQRWYRAKEYFPSDEDERMNKALRDVKTLLKIDKFYPWI